MGKKRTEFQLLQESMEKKSTELTSVLREAEAECAARQREARVRERQRDGETDTERETEIDRERELLDIVEREGIKETYRGKQGIHAERS